LAVFTSSGPYWCGALPSGPLSWLGILASRSFSGMANNAVPLALAPGQLTRLISPIIPSVLTSFSRLPLAEVEFNIWAPMAQCPLRYSSPGPDLHFLGRVLVGAGVSF